MSFCLVIDLKKAVVCCNTFQLVTLDSSHSSCTEHSSLSIFLQWYLSSY